ncbi:MBL fold metallo-hydrolase [bacterium]|nr:MBL fold metallo-hydrolase [bacterium]
MKICLLGSGSKGNCIYVESRGSAVLIDQGFSHSQIVMRLESRGLDTSKIKAILLTHEHEDHIRGVGITARKLGIPVYGTQGTLDAKRKIFNSDEELIPIEGGVSFTIGSLEILPFSVSHDAADPVQFCVFAGGKKASIATDLGFVSTLVEERLRNSDLVVIEANHDIQMLQNGSYTWQLKQRIMSKMGHLSNRNAAELLFNLLLNGSPKAVLAHLSEENNRPELAEKEVRDLFEQFGKQIQFLEIAPQHEATRILEI